MTITTTDKRKTGEGAIKGWKTRRRNCRVKLPIKHAHELEATLYNVREFCGMRDASRELMDHIASCQRNLTKAIADRNRVAGVRA